MSWERGVSIRPTVSVGRIMLPGYALNNQSLRTTGTRPRNIVKNKGLLSPSAVIPIDPNGH
jgi:hypothetical protein